MRVETIGDCVLYCGDALETLKTLPEKSVRCCVTSPPYFGLRDYGHDNQIGLEKTPEEYVGKLVAIFREVRRVLTDDGSLWLNLGDSYCSTRTGTCDNSARTLGGGKKNQVEASKRPDKSNLPGLKPKDLIGIPWRVAFALQADGWWLRSDIIWAKRNVMPESVTDRPTRAHEYIFLLSKNKNYYYDHEAVKEPCVWDKGGETEARLMRAKPDTKAAPTAEKNGIRPRVDKQRGHSRRHAGFNDRWDAMSKEAQCSGGRNKRDVWFVATKPFAEAHFATFPIELITPCILAGSAVGDVVLDPFGGAGTTAMACAELGRKSVLIELNDNYCAIARKRIETAHKQTHLFPAAHGN